jgi:class 3 adenylate cyclase
MLGTRKIASILVADIVGYSRLAGADEDRTPRNATSVFAIRTSPLTARPPHRIPSG